MKLFSSERYTKPGKGVEKNEKPKPAFIRFFIVLWNKRWKIMGINFLYVVFNLLMAAIAYLVFSGCISLYCGYTGDKLLETLNSASLTDPVFEIYWKMLFFFVAFVTSVPMFAIGPFRAGFTYIFKSFYKEEPVFLWTDFITKSRSNLKLGIQASIINFLGTLVVCMSTMAMFVISKPEYEMPFLFCFIEWALVIFFGVLIAMLSLYVYPMMVTFNVNLKQLYKNSFILCIVKWFRNLLVLLLDALIIALPLVLLPTTNYIVFVLMLVLYFALIPGIIAEVNMFTVYPVLKKYMIDNVNADKSEKPEEEPKQEPEEPKKTGRFENGMWIED